MVKKVLLSALLLIAILSIGLFIWVRSVFADDAVRTTLAAQLSKSLGQPVKVGSIGATLYPRVSVSLGDVAIGDPAKIRVNSLKVGADFRALLSRRIEHATLDLSGARVELPLPEFSLSGSSPTASAASKPPVDLVSVDAVVLHGVEIVSGGRTLSSDVEVVPEGKGLNLKRIALAADRTAVDVTGHISDLSGPVGDVAIKAGALNFDQLLAFANDFAKGAGIQPTGQAGPSRSTATSARPPSQSPMNIAVSIDATRATMGQLRLEKLAGKARLTSDSLTLNPVSFGIFGGRYDGSLTFALGAVPDFRLNARVSDVDVAAATAFAGNPGTISGRLSGKLNLTGRGMDVSSVRQAARGTMRVDVVNGSIKNLGLIRTIVVVTSGRSGASSAGVSRDEPFTKLGATLAIANGSASTQDLRFESKDVLLTAAGTMRLDGSAISLPGQVQLSDDLSKQAGRDLVRYTQDQGRVTLPATITGSAAAPQVRVDVASMAKRAVTNRANEEAQKALKKGISGLFKKR
jgi:uncharacterized protein involved in outer membrane biogenesis